ncbi:MAG TPA: FHA domain-containing protein [Armatimonadota bacterium]|nr:FHA domain-containing protein [Armatimonadota bacterium]
MEVTELTLWIARLGVLSLMYILLLVLIFSLRADAKAASSAPRPMPQPTPIPTQTPMPAPVFQATPSPSTAGVHSLMVVAGTTPTTGREYQLFGPIEIGRGTSCNVIIPNHFVSSRHARIFQDNGQWFVEDLGSTNGSALNGKPLLTPQQLHAGDKLLIGDTEFIIQ